MRWNYQHDFAKWAARWPDGPKFTVAKSCSSETGGRFWFHAGTTIGMTHPDYVLKHPMLDPHEPAHGLANHYTYLWPECTYQKVRTIPPLLPTIPWESRFEFVIPCFECGKQGVDIGKPPWATNPRESLVLVGIDTKLGKHAGFLSPEGEIWTDKDVLSEAAQASLSDASLKWSRPVEANPLTGRGASNPVMVGLSSDGTSISESLAVSKDGLVLTGGVKKTMVFPPALFATTAVPRNGFASVYVRSMGLVFLVGGQDSAEASEEGPVVVINVETGQRMQLAVHGYTPATVVATTYSVQDSALWVIEELEKTSSQSWVKIVRIGVPDGSVRVYGPWPRLKRIKYQDKLWLTTDLAGRLVLITSSQKHSKYSVQALREQDGRLRAAWIHRGTNATLGAGPIVDLSGLRLIMISGDMVRVTEFDSLPVSDSEIIGDETDTIAEALL